ncbi:hypothetical protein AB0L56_09640 [Streptomyces sp. NPDC052079]|uniref:hypothetical protein n=1 Tax=Streptomyces sp. NPDC052079 TaxID=3155526 RepID=UPI003446FE35
MRRHRRAVIAAAAIVTVVGAVGLANARPEPSTPRPHALGEAQKDTLHEAEEVLTRACMASHGFKTWVVPRRPLPDDRDFPYVVDDLRWASRHGYGSDLSAQREKLRTSDPNRRYFAGLTSSEQKRALDALHGRKSARHITARDPAGMTVGRVDDGCRAQAQRELYGDLETWFRVTTVTDALAALRSRMTAGDAEFTKSVEDWSTCMRARGFPYATPQETRAAFNADRGISREREIRTAVTEARCAASTGLSRTAHRLGERYGKQLRQRYEEEVRTRLTLENEALARARTIVRSQ